MTSQKLQEELRFFADVETASFSGDGWDKVLLKAAARIDQLEAALEGAVVKEREECAKICDEMAEHWADYKNTALLNGDVALSNAASGEPRAAIALASAIRARSEVKS